MATNITNRNRQPKGTSKGGQFAPETHATAPNDLDGASNNTPPSVAKYYDNGNPKREEWRDKDGNLDRADGPARIEYAPDGKK